MNITDKINNASVSNVARSAFLVLDAVQAQPVEEQIHGAGMLFLLWCKRYNLNPRDVITTTSYMFRDGLAQQNQHVFALRHFMKVDIEDPYSFSF